MPAEGRHQQACNNGDYNWTDQTHRADQPAVLTPRPRTVKRSGNISWPAGVVLNISGRYYDARQFLDITALHSAEQRRRLDARARHPGTLARVAHAWLRTPQAADRSAWGVSGFLIWIALPRAAPHADRRADRRERRPDGYAGAASAARLRIDGHGPAALHRASSRYRSG